MKKVLTAFVFFILINTVSGQVTIENLLSVPFPTDLKSSEGGQHIAWVFNDKGVRNLFVADAPEFKARQITKNAADDGIDLTLNAFTPDGKKILFTEGNSNNRSGEPANPALLQRETGKTVWAIDADGTSIKKISSGTEPVASPDNKNVVFIFKNEIWHFSFDTSKVASQLVRTRGKISSLRWSPSGDQLAFISNRDDHAFLGIYDLVTKTVSYPDPSVDVDDQPVWSPDGNSIAFVRTPARKERLPFTEERTGHPWSIRLLNVKTGSAKEIWRAQTGPGSVLFFDLPSTKNLLLWTADNWIVFPSEKDGWAHLYALNSKDGKTRLLTPGEGEVENVVLNEDKNAIIYTTNHNDTHRRHIWKAKVAGGSPVQLSRGEGIEYSPVITTNGIVVLRASATSPAWPYLISGDGVLHQLAAEMFPSSFPQNALVVPKPVTFKSKDGMLINGQLFLPPNYDPAKKYPALLFFHGGSRRQMLLGFHYMDYYSHDYAMNEYNAINGYIVLSVNYRSGIGYGLNFREALNYGANGGSEYNDVIGAGLYMKSRTDVDADRIGLWGGSYGGYLTAMGLARNSDVFACGVDIHGVHDWSEEEKNWVADYDPSLRSAFAKVALESSPVHFVKGWRSPVLFIHGDDDRNVPFEQSVMMVEKLRDQGVYFEQLVFPDEVHSFLLHSNWLKAYHASEKFFKKFLNN